MGIFQNICYLYSADFNTQHNDGSKLFPDTVKTKTHKDPPYPSFRKERKRTMMPFK